MNISENTPDLETRLRQAAATVPVSSVAEAVMQRIEAIAPALERPKRVTWQSRISYRVAGLAAFSAVAASVVAIICLTGPGARLTLADVKNAVNQQQWVHVQYDVGPYKELWTRLETGETFCKRTDGSAVYINDRTNTRLWYWNTGAYIDEDQATIYPPGTTQPAWKPQTAWEQFVAPYADLAATTQPGGTKSAGQTARFGKSVPDRLNNRDVVRFDDYQIDSVGKTYLASQLWADPVTHLPMRIKEYLQLGDRESTGKDWSTGDYDFPQSGPADLYALGVPRDTPIKRYGKDGWPDAKPVLDAINRNCDNFLKNYRVVIATQSDGSIFPFEGLTVLWREGARVRQDGYSPISELLKNPKQPMPELLAGPLMSWASNERPRWTQLLTAEREYSWSSPLGDKQKPQVQVTKHQNFPLLDTNQWLEAIQWPTRNYAPEFELLDKHSETPNGCIGLRNESGNSRTDYYVDPANDYVCVLEVSWKLVNSAWVRLREYSLSNLHRVDGRVVAGTQRMHDWGDASRKIAENFETMTIDLTPVNTGGYPAGIFDPAKLTDGADVIGY